MPDHDLPPASAAAFARAREALSGAPLRPEVTVEPVPAPARLAPAALGLSLDVSAADEELANGRFLLLHDPSSPTAWGGAWRLVTYARARMDAHLADDPLLARVGWSWLQDSLAERRAAHTALAGAVTRVVDERFGDLEDVPVTVDLEVRASWTPRGGPERMGDHLLAFTDLLGHLAGLPPLPEGVVLLARR